MHQVYGGRYLLLPFINTHLARGEYVSYTLGPQLIRTFFCPFCRGCQRQTFGSDGVATGVVYQEESQFWIFTLIILAVAGTAYCLYRFIR